MTTRATTTSSLSMDSLMLLTRPTLAFPNKVQKNLKKGRKFKRCARHGDFSCRLGAPILSSPSSIFQNPTLDILQNSYLRENSRPCGHLDKNWELDVDSVVTWTALISGYVRKNMLKEALQLFVEMQEEGIQADEFTFSTILRPCGLQEGSQIHASVVKLGMQDHVVVANALIDMYSKCGKSRDAHRVFNQLSTRNVVNWTTLISEYARGFKSKEVFQLFVAMLEEGTGPDELTFTYVIPLTGIDKGRQIHACVQKTGLQKHEKVGSALLDMYAKNGQLDDARKVFDELPVKDVVNWTAMISAYSRSGDTDEAIRLFVLMQEQGIRPDKFSFSTLLPISKLEHARQMHACIVKHGFGDGIVLGTTLLAMYARSGQIDCARRVFDALSRKDVFAWNTLMSGYVKCGKDKEAMDLFINMQQEGIQPDGFTYSMMLSLSGLQQGKQIHAGIMKSGIQNVWIRSALVDMYTEFGQVKDARRVFESNSTIKHVDRGES